MPVRGEQKYVFMGGSETPSGTNLDEIYQVFRSRGLNLRVGALQTKAPNYKPTLPTDTFLVPHLFNVLDVPSSKMMRGGLMDAIYIDGGGAVGGGVAEDRNALKIFLRKDGMYPCLESMEEGDGARGNSMMRIELPAVKGRVASSADGFELRVKSYIVLPKEDVFVVREDGVLPESEWDFEEFNAECQQFIFRMKNTTCLASWLPSDLQDYRITMLHSLRRYERYIFFGGKLHQLGKACVRASSQLLPGENMMRIITPYFVRDEIDLGVLESSILPSNANFYHENSNELQMKWRDHTPLIFPRVKDSFIDIDRGVVYGKGISYDFIVRHTTESQLKRTLLGLSSLYPEALPHDNVVTKSAVANNYGLTIILLLRKRS